MQSTTNTIINEAVLAEAKQYIAACNAQNIPVRKAILFGSQVRGTATNDSDIDLLIVSSSFSDNSLDNWKLLSPITARFYHVEPHPYPTKNFSTGDPFVNEIKKYGIEIAV
jgi:predicted nucleotidyltransferase